LKWALSFCSRGIQIGWMSKLCSSVRSKIRITSSCSSSFLESPKIFLGYWGMSKDLQGSWLRLVNLDRVGQYSLRVMIRLLPIVQLKSKTLSRNYVWLDWFFLSWIQTVFCKNPPNPNPEAESSDDSLQKNDNTENIFKIDCPLNLWMFLIQNKASSRVFLSTVIWRGIVFRLQKSRFQAVVHTSSTDSSDWTERCYLRYDYPCYLSQFSVFNSVQRWHLFKSHIDIIFFLSFQWESISVVVNL
jgi:hypothetical protein